MLQDIKDAWKEYTNKGKVFKYGTAGLAVFITLSFIICVATK